MVTPRRAPPACAHSHRSGTADPFTTPLALPVSTVAARPVWREAGRSASSPAARLHQSLERCRLGHSTHKSTGRVTYPVSDAADAARAAEGAPARVHRRPRSVAHGAGVRRRVKARWATGRTAWTLPPRTSRRYENRTARVTRWVGTRCHVFGGRGETSVPCGFGLRVQL
jgi:hypothetical protein